MTAELPEKSPIFWVRCGDFYLYWFSALLQLCSRAGLLVRFWRARNVVRNFHLPDSLFGGSYSVRVQDKRGFIGMKNISCSNLIGCACVVLSLLIAGCGSSGSSESAAVVNGSGGGSLVISGAPQSAVTADIAYSFIPAADDPEGDSLVFSIVNRPSWASFDTGTGALAGVPGQNDVGVYADIVISVSDGSDSAALSGFDIEVLGTATGAATLSWVAPTQNADNTTLTDHAGYRVRYGTSVGSYPNVKTITNIGVTNYMVENLSPATWFFVVTAFDSSGNESMFSNVVSKAIQ